MKKILLFAMAMLLGTAAVPAAGPAASRAAAPAGGTPAVQPAGTPAVQPAGTPAVPVTGTLYTGDGNVVEGASVEAIVPVAGTPLAKATTSADGRFALAGLPDGVIELVIAKEGTPEQSVLAFAGDIDLTITMGLGTFARDTRNALAPARGDSTIKGVVRLDGKPLANAPVILGGMDTGGEFRVLTNAKGEYVATGLPAQRFTAMIDPRLLRRVRTSRQVQAEPVHDVELTRAPIIRGRITDAGGKPVARAEVRMVLAERAVLDFIHELSARTNADGRYVLPAPEWSREEKAALAVTVPRHSTVRSKTFAFGTGEHTIDLQLPKFEAVRVRVADRAGKPLPEAEVAFATTNDTATFDTALLLLVEPFAARAQRTDANGELLLHLAPETYDFAAAAEGFQSLALERSIARSGNLDLVLERAAALKGRVHREGKGVANVRVMIAGVRPRRDGRDIITGGDGTFSIDGLAPGQYRLQFFKEDELIDRTLDVTAPSTIDVPLPPASSLQARVFDAATGLPVREFAISVMPAERNPNARGGPGIHRGEQSADGTFTVTVPVGTYRVTAGAAGYVSAEPTEVRVTEREPARVDIPLSRGISISGRVTDETGLPVADATVLVMDPDEGRGRRPANRNALRVAPGHAQTKADGTFTITGVETGPAEVLVRKDGFVPHRARIVAEETPALDIRLARGLTLRGIVTRGSKPVAGAQVGASTSAVGGDHQSAVTDEDGRFVLQGLIAVRYTVNAFLEETNAEVRNVDPSQQKEIVISLDPRSRGVVYGIVSGIPPADGGKYVRRTAIVQGSDDSAEGMIDAAGNYRIENAPLGHVQVSAYVETAARTARSSAQKQVEVIAGQPLRVDLDLGGSVRVSGRITHEGRAIGGANIGFSSVEGMSTASTTTRDDGTYDIALAAPGRYHVYARSERLNDRHVQTVRDLRDGDRLDIELREQTLEGVVVDANTTLPIEGALVTLTPAGGAMVAVAAEVPTDAQGRFRILAATSGAYRLIVSAPGYAHRTVPAETTQIELSPTPELRVRVLDAHSSVPLDAHIVIRDRDGNRVPARPQRSGATFAFSLAPGRYQLEVIVNGYGTRKVDVVAPGTIDVPME